MKTNGCTVTSSLGRSELRESRVSWCIGQAANVSFAVGLSPVKILHVGMHHVQYTQLDLNLLPVLEAIYEEKNLSRAGVRLAMTSLR